MNVRTSLVLLLVLVMIVGYLAFSEFRPSSSSPEDEGPAPWFYAVSSEDITRVSIIYKHTEETFVRGEGLTDWFFDDPYRTPLDFERWSGITLLLEGPRSRRLLFDKVDNLTPYGLEEPSATILVNLTGDREFQILFGNNTEDGTSHYVQLSGSSPVYLIDSGWGNVLTRLATIPPYPIWYYRSPADQVSEIEANYKGTTASFIQDSKFGWQLNTSDRASERSSVDSLWWGKYVSPVMEGPSVQYQVAPDQEDSADYGLDKPFAVISIGFDVLKFASEGPVNVFRVLEWSIGNKTDDDKNYYAKVRNLPEVLAVDANWVESFLSVAEQYQGAIAVDSE